MSATVIPGLERRLRSATRRRCGVRCVHRGRYATDASHYQVMPVGVVAPRSVKEAEHALALAREEGVSVWREGPALRRLGRPSILPLSSIARNISTASWSWTSPASVAPSSPAFVLDDLNRKIEAAWYCGFRSTFRLPRARPSAAWWATTRVARPLRMAYARKMFESIDARAGGWKAGAFRPIGSRSV